MRPNKRLSKQSWGWWFETPSRSLWRLRNEYPKQRRLSYKWCRWILIQRQSNQSTIHPKKFAGEFPAQMASNAENVSIWWRHHVFTSQRQNDGGLADNAFRCMHDDAMIWKRVPHYWPFVREIHRWPVDSPHKGPVMRTFGVSIDVSLNKRCSRLFDVTVMCYKIWLYLHRLPFD